MGRVAARVMVRKGQPLLCTIVGDSLLQPFWPEGTGCARGFLSAMDCGWLIRDWMLGKKNPIKMLVERELTRSILNQTTDGNVEQKVKERAKGNNGIMQSAMQPHCKWPVTKTKTNPNCAFFRFNCFNIKLSARLSSKQLSLLKYLSANTCNDKQLFQ